MQSVTSSGGGLAVLHDQRDIKEAMRERIRAERRRRGPGRRDAAAAAVAAIAMETPEIARARCVAAYISAPTAPGTLPLRRALAASGIRVLLPALLDDGRLDWSPDVDEGRPRTGWQPRAGTPLEPDVVRPDTIDLLELEGISGVQAVIVPALAVDTLGNRLGQGSGFYDRALATVDDAVPVFAVAYEDEVLDAAVEPVPTEPHDHPVDAVITPHRCLRLTPLGRH